MNKQPFLSVLMAILSFLALGLTLTSCENPANSASKPKTYTVTFDANGGTGSVPDPRTAQANTSITIPGGGGLSKTGYTFGGWNTEADGTGTNYSMGTNYIPEGNVTLYAKWNTITYIVTFNANGGNGTSPSPQNVQAGSSTTFPDEGELTKPGFTFGGWNTSANGTGTHYNAGDSWLLTSSITLYAQWNAFVPGTTYTITFNANGGSGLPPTAQTIDAGSSIILPSEGELTKTGYTFGGWNTNVYGTGDNYSVGSSYVPVGNITLYAQWDFVPLGSFTVTFNSNEGSSVPNQIIVSGNVAVRPANPTQSGYIFDNWYSDVDLTTVYIFSTPITDNIFLYAKWTPITYTVSFNANGGTGYMATSSHTYDVDKNLDINTFNRTGYTFGGWARTSSGATEFADNASVKNLSIVAGDTVTLYAQWNPITYTVTYHKNNADATGTMADSSHVYDVDKNLNINTFTRTGYTFGGWAETPDGAVQYTNDQSVKNLSAVAGSTVTLYAQWVDSSTVWTVRFETNGGNAIGNATVLKNTPVIQPPHPTRTDYTFENWYSNPELTALYNFSSIVISDMTLYAKWYSTVTFNANGAMSGTAPTSQTASDGSSITLPGAGSLTKTGYTFAGWNINTSGTGDNFSAGSSYIPNGNITLYAKWNINHYTVTFNANSGTPAPEQQTIDYGEKVNEPGVMTRTGYSFGGWYKESGFTNQWNFASDTVAGAITLHAKWNINQYTVTFNANSGTPVPVQQTIDHGGKVTTPGAMTRTNYSFGGWYKESNFTNQWNFASDTVTSAITLHAKWNPNTAGITLDVKQIIDGAPIIADMTISRTNNGYPVTQTVSVNAADYDAGSIRWEVAGVGAYAGQTVTGSGASFALNAAEVKYNSLGGHALILTVAKNGQQYQRAIPFTIVR